MAISEVWDLAQAFGLVLNEDGVIVEATDSVRSVIGASKEDILGTHWSTWYDETDSYVRTVDGHCQHVRVSSLPTLEGQTLWVEDDKATQDAITIANHYRDDLKHLEYAVSHDLFEPLRGVTASLGLYHTLYAEGMTEDQTEILSQASSCAGYIHRLLTDFLDYLRVDVHRKRELIRVISLQTIMDDVCQSLRLLIVEANATITYENLPSILGDGRMLHQIFSNLISNAVKFRAKDRPCIIRVTATACDEHWCVEVIDNGRGIHDAKQDRIFSPFVRVHKDVLGSGIGLAIVKRCIEFHGGAISIQSEIGKGTTMHLTLPRTYDPRDTWPDTH